MIAGMSATLFSAMVGIPVTGKTRDKLLNFKVTKEEKELIEAVAKRFGIAASTWARDLVLSEAERLGDLATGGGSIPDQPLRPTAGQSRAARLSRLVDAVRAAPSAGAAPVPVVTKRPKSRGPK